MQSLKNNLSNNTTNDGVYIIKINKGQSQLIETLKQ